MDIVLKSTNTLEAARFWICIAKGQYSLEFGEISDFWNIVALSHPFAETVIVSVVFSPTIFSVLDRIGPPPRVNIKMVN